MSGADARAANWRFIVPDEPSQPLVLDAARAARQGLAEALGPQPVPAVVVPDLAAWDAGSPRSALRDAATAVAPGGWLCVGFPNRLFPTGALAANALALRTATATLRASGLTTTAVYLPLPDQRRPALVVDSLHRGCLDYVFQNLLVPYLPGGSVPVRVVRRLLAAARHVAAALPHRLRVALAPAYLVVARRPQ